MTQYRKAEKQELVSVPDRMKQLEDERDALQAKCDAKGVLIDAVMRLVDQYILTIGHDALIEPEAGHKKVLDEVHKVLKLLQTGVKGIYNARWPH